MSRDASIWVAPHDARQWRVVKPYLCMSRLLPARCLIVPVGFLTDGASVPRFFWRLLPKYGRYFTAAVVHDYLYRAMAVKLGMTRQQCDLVFLELMERDGVRPSMRRAMYWAVRAFGWMSFNAKGGGNDVDA